MIILYKGEGRTILKLNKRTSQWNEITNCNSKNNNKKEIKRTNIAIIVIIKIIIDRILIN